MMAWPKLSATWAAGTRRRCGRLGQAESDPGAQLACVWARCIWAFLDGILVVISAVAGLTERARCNGWFATGAQIVASADDAF